MGQPTDLAALSREGAPSLAGDDCYDERLEKLLHGQQEVIRLLLGGGTLQDLLSRIVLIAEDVFAPALCVISIAQRGGVNAVKYQAAVSMPLSLLNIIARQPEVPDPTGHAILSGRRSIVTDFSTAPHWPEHAQRALMHGLRSCWAEPIPDCGDDLAGIATLYFRDERRPDVYDERLLCILRSFIGLALNIAQQHVAFRAANDRFTALVSAIPGVVYQRVVKPDGDIRYTYISEGARDLFGVSPQEILADPEVLFSTHSPEYRAKFRERLLAASKALTTWDVEATLVTAAGRKKHTHAIARPDRQEDGSVLWTGVILDETRTREAIVDSIALGLLLYDAQDRLIMRNSHYLTFFPTLSGIAVPGATYQEVVQAECKRIALISGESAEHTKVLRGRLERRTESRNVFEWQIGTHHWLLVNEQRTGDGGSVILYTDITELKRREKQIQHLADHDSLTDLPNRRLFNRRIEDALMDAQRTDARVVVMCLDVDHFKHVNDSLGHPAGDKLLRRIGERLVENLSEIGTVARLGGDEFGVVLANIGEVEEATQVAWRLLDLLSDPVDFNGQLMASGVSIGIAVSGTDGNDPEELLKNADLALYRAKADGRGTFRCFEKEMDARAQARRSLEIDLREAITTQQLELHYQPQIHLDTNEIVGFEALLRWCHPTRGSIPPSEFIPIAEETGLIVRLGEWVLRRACSDAKGWPNAVRVAVNVSAVQFRNHDLAQLVTQVLCDTGLPARRLELEITESVLLRDVESNLAVLQELSALGVRISMDDFGTGYSSLANLRSFPFNKIKIDRSFVGDLLQNRDSAAIVRAVLGLGRSLGMETCAEGVETREQLVQLQEEGCKEVQGFYYSKAVPNRNVPRLLDATFDAFGGLGCSGQARPQDDGAVSTTCSIPA